MSARCETVGKYVLPIFRALVAKELVGVHHLTQVEVAQKLGTTQAAISQYVNSKRAFKGVEQVGDALPKIETQAKKTAKRLAKGEISWADVTVDFCRICVTFSGAPEPAAVSEDYAI